MNSKMYYMLNHIILYALLSNIMQVVKYNIYIYIYSIHSILYAFENEKILAIRHSLSQACLVIYTFVQRTNPRESITSNVNHNALFICIRIFRYFSLKFWPCYKFCLNTEKMRSDMLYSCRVFIILFFMLHRLPLLEFCAKYPTLPYQ